MDEAEAMADFEAAEKLDPSNSDVFHHRGQLNLLLDRTKEACRDFEKSVALEPDFALAQMQNAYTQYRYEYAYTHIGTNLYRLFTLLTCWSVLNLNLKG